MSDAVATITTVDEEQALRVLRRLNFDWCVRLRDVWTNDPTDVDSLHGRLREEFQQKLLDLTADPAASPLGWPIVGIGGTGKTHLLSQFRRFAIDHNSAFILVDMTDVRDFWDTVLQGYVDSLQETVGEETQQFVILRRFLDSYFKDPVDRTLKALTSCSADQLTGYISKILRYLQRKKGQPAVKHQDAIRAICCLNSDDFDVQSVGLSWLQGQTLDEEWRQALGFRVAQQSPRQTVMSLSWYLSLVGLTVVGFDQLDPIVHQIQFASADDGPENSAAQAIVQWIAAGLADLRELHRTFPVVTCVESTWNLLPQCAMSTSLDRFESARLLGNAESLSFAESLISRRVARACADADWKPPFPTWPFLPSALEQLSTETPRVILKKCEEHRRAMLAEGRTWQVEDFSSAAASPPPSQTQPEQLPETPTPGSTASAIDPLELGTKSTGAASEETEPPRTVPDSGEALKDLNERFEHLKTGVDLNWLLDHTAEDDRLAPLYVTAFQCLLIEQAHRIPDNVDPVIDRDFSGKANARPLHARLRLVFHDENSREEHYCVRGLEWKHFGAYQARLKAAMTTSGIDRDLKFRHLVVPRTTDIPSGKKTAELTETFRSHGGTLYPISESDLLTLHALRHMREEGDPAFDAWLRSRTPVTRLRGLLSVLVPDSLFLKQGVQSDKESPDTKLDSSRQPQPDQTDRAPSFRETPPASTSNPTPVVASTKSDNATPPGASESGRRIRKIQRSSRNSEKDAHAENGKAADGSKPDLGERAAEPETVSRSMENDPDVLLPLGDRVSVYGSGDTISIPAKVLAKHTIVLGGAGSGKTVTVRRIIEEAALAGIPSVIIDCAQDMCTFDESRDEPSRFWNDDDPGKSRKFVESTRQVVYTPGRNSGRPLSLEPIPDLTPLRNDSDELQAAVDMIRGSLQPVVASGKSQKAQNKAGILARSLKFFAQNASPTSLENYINLLDVLPAEAQLGIAKEEDLAREMADSLRIQIAQNPLLQSKGTPLDPAVLFGDSDDDNRTTLSAISLIGLQDLEQQRSFINQLSMLLFSWIKKNPHPPNGRALRGLLVIDEARDFIPAVKTSSCKDSMIRLAAQARKYKLGIVLATQHPKDIDTKIVGNCATQFFGRMVSPASLATANQMLQTMGVKSPKLSKHETGRFYVNFPDGMLKEPALIQMPDSLTAGRLLTEEEVVEKSRKEL